MINTPFFHSFYKVFVSPAFLGCEDHDVNQGICHVTSGCHHIPGKVVNARIL
jgi:hypothetical protein